MYTYSIVVSSSQCLRPFSIMPATTIAITSTARSVTPTTQPVTTAVALLSFFPIAKRSSHENLIQHPIKFNNTCNRHSKA